LKKYAKSTEKKIATINQGLGDQKLKKNKEFRLNKNFMTFGSQEEFLISYKTILRYLKI